MFYLFFWANEEIFLIELLTGLSCHDCYVACQIRVNDFYYLTTSYCDIRKEKVKKYTINGV